MIKKAQLQASDNQRLLASAPDGEAVDAGAAAKAIRESGEQIQTAVASLLDYLEEPLKGQFIKVKDQINTMLAKLPVTDQVPASLDANSILRQLLGVLGYAQDMIKSLSGTAQEMGQKMQTMRASLSGDIEAAIAQKVKDGELINKADHETALNAAIAAAKTAVKSEIAVFDARRTSLNSLGLPVPADDLIAGEEKDFEAKRDEAKGRAEALKPYKISQDRLMALCWGPKESFENAVELLKDATAAAVASGNATGAKSQPSGFLTQSSAAANQTGGFGLV